MSIGSLRTVSPMASLKPYIRHYVIIEPHETSGGGVFLPYSGAIASFFNEAPVVVNGKATGVVRTTSPTLFGPVGEPFRYTREAPQRSRDVSVVFTALGSALLCGPVMDELESTTADLECLVGTAETAELTERLYEAGDTGRIVELLDSYFFSHFRRSDEKPVDLLAATVALLESTSRPLPTPRYDVDTLKEQIHCSARQLHRLMLRATGLSPKRYLSILRINHVMERMRRAPKTSLARIASAFGYSDQAHFIRDFERHTWSKPSAFFGSDEHRGHRTFMDYEEPR
jgi:AraC-like DNA-binding protein